MKSIVLKMSVMVPLTLIFHGTTYSQNTEDIFLSYANNIVWLGVDFSNVKLTGDMGTVSSNELIPLFEKINLLIITERDKYDIKGALKKTDVPFDLVTVNKINSEINPDNIISVASSLNPNPINEALIADMVKQYQIENFKGIGMVFFMESLDKPSETGIMWVTFFNLSDHKVLLTEQMRGAAGGAGFRNHWAAPVYDVLKQIKNTKFREWKAKYSK